MSSQTVEKKSQIFPIYKTSIEDSINFDDIIVHFSDLGTSKSAEFIYNGNEKITFKKRHPVFRKLFLNEFKE